MMTICIRETDLVCSNTQLRARRGVEIGLPAAWTTPYKRCEVYHTGLRLCVTGFQKLLSNYHVKESCNGENLRISQTRACSSVHQVPQGPP